MLTLIKVNFVIWQCSDILKISLMEERSKTMESHGKQSTICFFVFVFLNK